VTQSPYPGPAASAPAAPHNPNVSPFNSPLHDRLCRTGLWLGVLSGVLCIVAGLGDRTVTTQGGVTVTFTAAAFLSVGITAVILFGLSVLLPYAWARITGIGLLAGFSSVYGIMVTVARITEDFVVGPEITISDAGKMLLLAFVAASVGLAFSLVGAPRIGRAVERDDTGAPLHRVATSGYAVASLVLSLCGLITGITAALGVAFAVAAFDDISRSGGARTGRGMAVAGLVVGIVVLALSALFMASLIGTADPSFNEA
jgi:hypothetical protein